MKARPQQRTERDTLRRSPGSAESRAGRFEDRVRELQSDWRGRVGRICRDSAVSLLIDALPAAPVLPTSTASELVWRSFQATSLAMERLVDAGVLVQVSIGRATAPSRPMSWSTR